MDTRGSVPPIRVVAGGDEPDWSTVPATVRPTGLKITGPSPPDNQVVRAGGCGMVTTVVVAAVSGEVGALRGFPAPVLDVCPVGRGRRGAPDRTVFVGDSQTPLC